MDRLNTLIRNRRVYLNDWRRYNIYKSYTDLNEIYNQAWRHCIKPKRKNISSRKKFIQYEFLMLIERDLYYHITDHVVEYRKGTFVVKRYIKCVKLDDNDIIIQSSEEFVDYFKFFDCLLVQSFVIKNGNLVELFNKNDGNPINIKEMLKAKEKEERHKKIERLKQKRRYEEQTKRIQEEFERHRLKELKHQEYRKNYLKLYSKFGSCTYKHVCPTDNITDIKINSIINIPFGYEMDIIDELHKHEKEEFAKMYPELFINGEVIK